MMKKRNIATSPCGFKVLEDSDQSFIKPEHIKTPINHSQDLSISRLQ